MALVGAVCNGDGSRLCEQGARYPVEIGSSTLAPIAIS